MTTTATTYILLRWRRWQRAVVRILITRWTVKNTIHVNFLYLVDCFDFFFHYFLAHTIQLDTIRPLHWMIKKEEGKKNRKNECSGTGGNVISRLLTSTATKSISSSRTYHHFWTDTIKTVRFCFLLFRFILRQALCCLYSYYKHKPLGFTVDYIIKLYPIGWKSYEKRKNITGCVLLLFLLTSASIIFLFLLFCFYYHC